MWCKEYLVLHWRVWAAQPLAGTVNDLAVRICVVGVLSVIINWISGVVSGLLSDCCLLHCLVWALVVLANVFAAHQACSVLHVQG